MFAKGNESPYMHRYNFRLTKRIYANRECFLASVDIKKKALGVPILSAPKGYDKNPA